jgi:hypothetical protein
LRNEVGGELRIGSLLPVVEHRGRGEKSPLLFLLTHCDILKRSLPAEQPPPNNKMKTTLREAANRAATYDALFKTAIKHAERHGLNEIRISVPRARELYRDLSALETALRQPQPSRHSTAHFARLDAIFAEQDRVMNEAISRIRA